MNAVFRSLANSRSSRRRDWRFAAGMALIVALLLSGLAQPIPAAIIYVTTLKEGIGTGACSLAEAIYASNLQASMAINGYMGGLVVIGLPYQPAPPNYVATGCVAGTGNDVIVLPPGQVLQFTQAIEDVNDVMGPAVTPVITSTVTIAGYGSTLLGGPCVPPPPQGPPGCFRAFNVGPGGNLTIQNTYVKGFAVMGGAGSAGGGGGMGAGGAVYVRGGTLIVENTTFDGNRAFGGNGGSSTSGSSGGGGGGVSISGFGTGQISDSFGEEGGGGGGSAGSGGVGTCCGTGSQSAGGGGTLFSAGTAGGYACGGDGGILTGNDTLDVTFGGNGQNARCDGGGGGGGIQGTVSSGNGGAGGYGGGGGGGAQGGGNGGNGGFGAGGGAGFEGDFGNTTGGNGGFGGGGGAGPNGDLVGLGNPGAGGGPYGGNADHLNGGGGAGLGGAIFNDSGGVRISNSTFTNNTVTRGVSGGGAADNGGDGGGAIFNVNGHLTVTDVTIANNQSTGSGGGIVVIQTDSSASTILNLDDTIIFNNGSMINGELTNAANECWVIGAGVGVIGAGNLIQNNNGCDGVVTTGDPQLGPLQNNGGFTPTMAIPTTSAAFNAADPDTSLSTDQRNDPRPEMGGFDIGAFELCIARNPNIVGECSGPGGIAPPPEQLTIQVSPLGAGTTTPGPGTYNEPQGTVVSLTATPALGYAFGSWSGNVGNQQGASTPIVMLEPQTVTANFVSCNCVVDISSFFRVTPGPIVLNPVTRQYAETVTVTNATAAAITSAISLVLDNLTNATLVNATGTTSFGSPSISPYITMNVSLVAGQTATFSLRFSDPTNGAITYTTRVLAP
jgi:List-Bact-rpt repeat protein